MKMNKLKRLAALLSLCAVIGAPPALAQPQQNATVVQDGIAVRPLSRWGMLAPKDQIDEQSAQQYSGLLKQAREKGALVPATDPRARRLRAIAQRLIPFAPRWNRDAANWNWQVNLLQSSEINAFCMPGGRIAFYTGILDSLKLTDDEIAAVMGHEIAHALREHASEQMGKSAATSIGARLAGGLVSSIFGIDPNVTGTVANWGTQLLALRYSRDDEREADLVGLDLAARAGFDPRAGIALWQKMAALNQQQPIALLSTHPGGSERIQRIEDHMNVLLPVYARAKGTTVDRLPPYRTNVALR
jgi:Zn-dependent protease with chaperone function